MVTAPAEIKLQRTQLDGTTVISVGPPLLDATIQ